MHETYGLEDLLNTLITLEETGNRVYSGLSKLADDTQSRELFAFLAEQELKHRAVYVAMRDERQYTTSIDEEYGDYIKVLIETTFTSIALAQEAHTKNEALTVGIQLEKDTLLFLNEVYGILGDIQGPRIKSIMNEERQHLRLLLNLRA